MSFHEGPQGADVMGKRNMEVMPHHDGGGWRKKVPSVSHAVHEEVKRRLLDSEPRTQLTGTKTDGD